MMIKGFFISGTGTNVGKTIISSVLVKKLGADYFKPIQCGRNGLSETDSDVVKKLCPKVKIFAESYFFIKPESPNIASQKENKKVELKEVLKIRKEKTNNKIIIEGAGGLQVPINDNYLMSDVAKKFNLPLILVAKTSLGTINHTLMSIQIIKEKKINFCGIVFIGNNREKTIKTIKLFGERILKKKIKIIGIVPKVEKITRKSIDNFTKLLNIK